MLEMQFSHCRKSTCLCREFPYLKNKKESHHILKKVGFTELQKVVSLNVLSMPFSSQLCAKKVDKL